MNKTSISHFIEIGNLFKFLVTVFLLLIISSKLAITYAIENPLNVPNNKFGIHIIDENDLSEAVSLVNSSGGEWGYVIMVVSENDRDIGKWQKTFDRMREAKIIPILRLATSPSIEGWRKPEISDIPDWITFLNSLNWVIENRYIILFNEPNHSKEWGGTIDPAGYANIVKEFSRALKSSSNDYFILNAGFDQATNNNHQSMDERNFLRQMYNSNPTIFSYFDGWVSHSYPNPNFSASPLDDGKGSIRGFEWELPFIYELGLKQNIPLFITETGWAHAEGLSYDESYKSSDYVANNIQIALNYVWNNSQIAVVAQFLLNYQDQPFDHFSWKKLSPNEFYPQYNVYKNYPKIKGSPSQKISAEISLNRIPNSLFTDSLFYLPIQVTNTGQKIWSPKDNISVSIAINKEATASSSFLIDHLKPFEKKIIKIPLRTATDPSSYTVVADVSYLSKSISPLTTTTIYTQIPKTLSQTILNYIHKIIQDYSQEPAVNPRG